MFSVHTGGFTFSTQCTVACMVVVLSDSLQHAGIIGAYRRAGSRLRHAEPTLALHRTRDISKTAPSLGHAPHERPLLRVRGTAAGVLSSAARKPQYGVDTVMVPQHSSCPPAQQAAHTKHLQMTRLLRLR